MNATIAEKILARHAGLDAVHAGDIVIARVDFAMVHDARAPNAIRMVDKMGQGGATRLPFASKTAWVLDHYSPPPNLEAAQTHTAMRRFADEHGSVLYDIGDGICHQVLPEGGHLTCGDLIVGTDTHSVTYGAFNAFASFDSIPAGPAAIAAAEPVQAMNTTASKRLVRPLRSST